MAGLFGTSGIRKRVAELPEGFSYDLGRAIACLLEGSVACGRDTRESGPALQKDFEKGLLESGRDVISMGIAPTPTVCVATEDAGIASVITASHNPPDYNGFKFFDSLGALKPQAEARVEHAFDQKARGDGQGIRKEADYSERHIKRIMSKVGEAEGVKVLLDCSGGAGSQVTPKLLDAMGCQATIINDGIDGVFPHGLEPTEKNLSQTMDLAKKADIDIAFAHDGDADRTSAIGADGRMIEWDTFLTVLAAGHSKVVTTVDASMRIEEFCKKVYRVPVGDVAVVDGIRKNGAGFGGEPSGTYIFPDIHIFPDGVATVAKASKLIANGAFYEIVEDVPTYPVSRLKIPCGSHEKESIMEGVKKAAAGENYTDIDGVRVERDWGWVLIRPSGTEDYMRITAEAQDEDRLAQLVKEAKAWLSA